MLWLNLPFECFDHSHHRFILEIVQHLHLSLGGFVDDLVLWRLLEFLYCDYININIKYTRILWNVNLRKTIVYKFIKYLLSIFEIIQCENKVFIVKLTYSQKIISNINNVDKEIYNLNRTFHSWFCKLYLPYSPESLFLALYTMPYAPSPILPMISYLFIGS